MKLLPLMVVNCFMEYDRREESNLELAAANFVLNLKEKFKLSQVSLNFAIKSVQDILVKGAVLAMLADTQAAHFLSGFKIGVGFSLRRCRNCLVTKDAKVKIDMQSM